MTKTIIYQRVYKANPNDPIIESAAPANSFAEQQAVINQHAKTLGITEIELRSEPAEFGHPMLDRLKADPRTEIVITDPDRPIDLAPPDHSK
ncbi:hypothetical protein [Psychromicrobium xiongbiense]|uniref:hypothetical protein n=1 Tax=Psychromicrobium xiongbiense TaxID=3051184 RepID=UPI0025574B9F|nr:hypothetical protein [Psychromicrobium sp. YIM S02556]